MKTYVDRFRENLLPLIAPKPPCSECGQPNAEKHLFDGREKLLCWDCADTAQDPLRERMAR